MNKNNRMKKILLLTVVALILSMPITLSNPLSHSKMSPFKKFNSSIELTDIFDGNLSGWFGIKNEDGSFEVLGDVEGYYISKIGFFVCTLNYSESTISNDIIGFYNDRIIIGFISIVLNLFGHEGQIGGAVPVFGTCQINTDTNELEAILIRPLKFDIYIYWQFCEFEE